MVTKTPQNGRAVDGADTPMRASPSKPVLSRLAVDQAEAAALLGVSVGFFRENVAPELRVVRRGRLVIYPIAELAGWLEREAERTL